jgi:hypothetical protein
VVEVAIQQIRVATTFILDPDIVLFLLYLSRKGYVTAFTRPGLNCKACRLPALAWSRRFRALDQKLMNVSLSNFLHRGTCRALHQFLKDRGEALYTSPQHCEQRSCRAFHEPDEHRKHLSVLHGVSLKFLSILSRTLCN